MTDFSIAPNPNAGTFRLKFSGEKKPLTVAVTDMSGEVFYVKEIDDFSGVFEEEISIDAPKGILNLAIMQNGLMRMEEIVIAK